MGLDMGFDLIMPRVNGMTPLRYEIFYFRKCFAISREVQEIIHKYIKQPDVDELEYVFDAGDGHNIRTACNIVKNLLNVFNNELTIYYNKREIDEPEMISYGEQRLYDYGYYMKKLNDSIFNLNMLGIWLSGKIFSETLIEAIGDKQGFNPNDVDFSKIKFEVYYSI